MYESHFLLSRRPFAMTPAADRYFAAAGAEAARRALIRCIDRSEGAGLIVGGSGIGKTLLCQVLAAEFRGRLDVVLLAAGMVRNPSALFQAILFELRLPYLRLDESELRLALLERLRAEGGAAGMLLLIDEAHLLPLKMFEELRQLANVVRDGLPRIRLVIAGGPTIEERLANPRLDSLNQQLAVRAYLEPFSREETADFVRSQVGRICNPSTELARGADRPEFRSVLPDPFTDAALDSIHRATDGIPRLINQLCDHALLLAYADGIERLDAKEIETAWADLQQLPAPWLNAGASRPAARRTDAATTLEFGSLADDEPPRLGDAPNDLNAATFSDPFTAFEEIELRLEGLDDAAPATATETGEVGADAIETPRPALIEEELVVDRYARLDALRGPQVSCPEGDVLSQLLALVRDVASTADPRPERDVTTPESEGIISSGAWESANAAEPVRDLIVVEEDPQPGAIQVCRMPGARREEFRRLFTELKQRQSDQSTS